MEPSLWAPEWLSAFWKAEYFKQCETHIHAMAARGKKLESSTKKTKKNMFCIDCSKGPLCRIGTSDEHKGHHHLQVRMASSHYTVEVSDIERWVDVTSIHKYVINGEPIVFLPSRPQEKQVKQVKQDHCEECGRGLDPGDRFCSIACKWKTKERYPGDASVNLMVPAFNREESGGSEMAGPSGPNPRQSEKKRARSASAQKASTALQQSLPVKRTSMIVKIKIPKAEKAYTALQQSRPVKRTDVIVNLKLRREHAPDLTGMSGHMMMILSSPKKQCGEERGLVRSVDTRHSMSPETLQHPATSDRDEQKPRNKRKGVPFRSPMI